MLRRALNHPAPPAVLLAVLVACGGCSVPDPYYVDDRPFAAAASASIPALNNSQIWVAPIQFRRGPTGDYWVDLLVAGYQAERAAYRWAQTPRDAQQVNAILALRRITPNPSPIRLATHDELKPLPRCDAWRAQWQPQSISAGATRVILSIPLKPRDPIDPGTYGVRLTPPGPSEAAPWLIQGLDVTLDEHPIESILAD